MIDTLFSFEMETVIDGLTVALYGLGGVFAVLILFYFFTKAIMAVLSKQGANKK